MIGARERLLALTNDGELILLAADPTRPTMLARTRVLRGGVHAAPALSGGVLFVRDDSSLVALPLGRSGG